MLPSACDRCAIPENLRYMIGRHVALRISEQGSGGFLGVANSEIPLHLNFREGKFWGIYLRIMLSCILISFGAVDGKGNSLKSEGKVWSRIGQPFPCLPLLSTPIIQLQ